MTYTVVSCRRWPGEDYMGNRVIYTDELLEDGDLGWRFFEHRALALAEAHAPPIPSYHLRVEKIGFLRYSVKAYQNTAEPDGPPRDPGMPTN